jgi:hypothetical protein
MNAERCTMRISQYNDWIQVRFPAGGKNSFAPRMSRRLGDPPNILSNKHGQTGSFFLMYVVRVHTTRYDGEKGDVENLTH